MKGLKRALQKTHLWLGLISGFFIFAICLSGTILAFELEITKTLEPEKFNVEPKGTILSEEELISSLEIAEGGKVAYVIVPENLETSYTFSLKKDPKQRHGTRYYLNPYTGEVLGNANGNVKEFFRFFFKLHRWMLLDPSIGRPITGIATLIFLVMLVSGLYLWWPVKLKLLNRPLKVHGKGSWVKLNFDLHQTLGFYSCILLLILALSGLNWSFEWYRNGASAVLGAKVFERESIMKEYSSGQGDTLLMMDMRAIADEHFEYKGFYRIVVGKGKSPVTEIRKYRSGFFAFSAPDKIWVNQENGQIIQIDDFGKKPVGSQLAAIIRDIHLGNAFGGFSKVLFFLAALIGTSLPITGTLIWFNKRKRKLKVTKRV